ncbi:hypothetical protein [Streptomyces sp. NPDC050856]|uniref:hypothetical protein n=1 Tax=Streptomyces sp. NPDC050856 TaxID=3154939 RepID=UPI0033D7DDE8
MAAGRRHAVVALCLALSSLSGCTVPQAPPDATATRAIQAALDRRAAAVLADGPDGLPLSSWSYRIVRVRRDGDRARVRAELRYRFAGHDDGAVTAERAMEAEERDGRWHVTADRPAEGAAPQLWEQGRLDVVRGRRSLVLGVGHDRDRLRSVAAVADRSVPAVSEAWPEPWAGRLVVLVPASLDAMGALLGAPAAGYRGVAAVTTGRAGGGADAPADRVIVNPEAYQELGEAGRAFVLTHETAHVATRAHTSGATPLWLSEGFADWVAHRGTGGDPARLAPRLRDAVRAGDLPAELPGDQDFALTGDQATLSRAYEEAWLACALIAERWGEAELTAFYRAVGERGRGPGSVEKALRDVLDTTPESFTLAWRAHLRERLG